MNKKYVVKLASQERKELRSIIRSGKHAAKKILRARILLKADAGWSDEKISKALDISIPQIERLRKQFVEMGFAGFINHRATRKSFRKLDGKQEAQLITIACSEAPEGHERWSLRMLAGEMVRLEYVDSIAHETVRQTLKKMN